MGARMTHETSTKDVAPCDPARRRQTRLTEHMRFFTIAEVGKFVAVSTRTVRRWIERKELVAHYFGGAVRIGESDLKAFIAFKRNL